MDRYMHGDEPQIAAEREEAAAARRDYLADSDEEQEQPLPCYDLRMIEMAERDIAAAQVEFRLRGKFDYEELAVGVVCDYGDVLLRALAFLRISIREKA